MPYGRTLTPGKNTPFGYEKTAEENLNLAGLGYQNPYGGMLGDAGQGLLGQYQRSVVPAQAAARAAAGYNPDLVSSAAVDAQMATDQAGGTLTRSLSRMGINPNSGRFVGAQTQAGLAGAALKAGAMTRAEKAEREGEFSRLMQAAGIGSEMAGLGVGAISGAGAASRANASGLEGLAREYGDLASQSEQAQATKKALAANDVQSRIDEMLAASDARLASMPNDWWKPNYKKM